MCSQTADIIINLSISSFSSLWLLQCSPVHKAPAPDCRVRASTVWMLRQMNPNGYQFSFFKRNDEKGWGEDKLGTAFAFFFI